jgi:hypothetical protein
MALEGRWTTRAYHKGTYLVKECAVSVDSAQQKQHGLSARHLNLASRPRGRDLLGHISQVGYESIDSLHRQNALSDVPLESYSLVGGRQSADCKCPSCPAIK